MSKQEIIKKTTTKYLYVEDLVSDSLKHIIAQDRCELYKLIYFTNSAGIHKYMWIRLSALSVYISSHIAKQFTTIERAIYWWMEEFPEDKIFNYDSMDEIDFKEA